MASKIEDLETAKAGATLTDYEGLVIDGLIAIAHELRRIVNR